MKKLFTILLLALAVGASAQLPSLKRNALTTNDLGLTVIPPGGGQITNVVWKSDSSYLIDGGTNTVSTYPNGALNVNNPHIFLRDKTNITLEGLGYQSVIKSGQTGTFITVFNCHNIKFRNFALIGTRGPETGGVFGSQFAGIEERGTNSDLFYEHVLFQDLSDQGISGCLNGDLSYTTGSRIINCDFVRVGTTNCDIGGGFDGTGVVMNGANITVEGCRFSACFRDCEPFMWHMPTNLTGLKIRGNTSMDCKEGSVYSQLNGVRDMEISGNTITYNPAMRDSAFDKHIGIVLGEARDVRIFGNKISWAEYPFYIAAGAGTIISGGQISGNHFSWTSHGGYLLAAAATSTNWGWVISGNTFEYGAGLGLTFHGSGHQIVNNVFLENALNSYDIWLRNPGGNITGSNYIAGNTFIRDNTRTGSAGVDYNITIDAGCNNNVITGNRFLNYGIAPYQDAGNNNAWTRNVYKSSMLQELPVSSVNAVATAANTTETDLASYTVPGLSLLSTNQALEFQAWGSFGATANNKVVRVKYGGATASNVLLDTLPKSNNAQEWMLSGTIQRVNATTLKAASRFEVSGFVTNDIITLTMDPTTNAIFRITGSNTVAAASDITLEGWKVRYTP